MAGVMCALRSKGLSFEDMASQRILIVGAGSAGIGVASSLSMAMQKHSRVTAAEAAKSFWLVDQCGLLTSARAPNALLPGQSEFTRGEGHLEGSSLVEVIKAVKPHVLLGLSGVGGLFTEEVCRLMAASQESPIIFPMSNPSAKAECTAEVAFRCTQGRAIFASGSPFDDVTLPDGTFCRANQANNMFIFPGLGLGAVIGRCKKVSDAMLMASAEALANFLSVEDLQKGHVYPVITDIRKVTDMFICGFSDSIFTFSSLRFSDSIFTFSSLRFSDSIFTFSLLRWLWRCRCRRLLR